MALNKSERFEDLQNGHIRVSTTIRNTSKDKLIRSKFNQTKNQSFVETCSDYDLVIEKLVVDASQIGIFIFGYDEDFPDNYNPDKYTITMIAGGNTYTVSVNYIQNDFIFSDLRVVYSIADFVQMVNRAFKDCYDLIPGGDRGTTTQPPFVEFRDTNTPLKMRYQTGYVNRDLNSVQPTPDVEVFCNYELYKMLFQGFSVEFGQTNGFVGPEVARFNVIENQTTALFVDSNAPEPQPSGLDDYIIEMTAQWASFYNLYDISGIIIKSSTFPSSKTLVTNQEVGGDVIEQSILTKFTITQFGKGNNSNSEIVYIPQPNYRRIPMYSNQGLDTINYTIEYEDRYGNSVPFNLNPGEFVGLDLLFIKKNLPG